MSFEAAYLQALQARITDRGGSVPPVTIPTSFERRHLELLDSLVAACGGSAVPDLGNHPASVLAKLRSAILGLGGAEPSGLYYSFEDAFIQYLERLVTASGGVVPPESWPGSFQSRVLALVGAIAASSGFAFSGLPNLPLDQQARVAASAGDQAIIDSLAKLDVWVDPYPPVFTDSAGTIPATTGNPVGNVLCYATGNAFTQSNAANQPTLAAGPSLTGGYTKTLVGTPGATGVQKLIVATNNGILVADADIPASYTVVNLPDTRGVFVGTLTADDINRIKAYAVAEGAVDNDFAAITNFADYFRNFSRITTFPLINTAAGTNFNSAWRVCSSLTTFPLIDTSGGTNFTSAWAGCSSLTSFPLINVSAGNNFNNTWSGCSSLNTFPSNFFNGCSGTSFSNAFGSTALNQASIDAILVSINSNGTTNGTFNQSGGSAPSATGQAAITAMRGRGWTVTVTGGF